MMVGRSQWVLVGALSACVACTPPTFKRVDYDSVVTSDVVIFQAIDPKVDILVVIDDSGTMAEEQAKLAANFGPFIETLEQANVDFRLAVTTTSGCGAEPTGGRFAATSCLDRPEAFSLAEVDRYADACSNHCALTTADLDIQPTALLLGGDEVARPWIESDAGGTNLGEGVTALAAFQCLAPQGISGCGYESQLESMAQALRNAQTNGEPEAGFLRTGAALLVLIVTDEADCSYDEAHADALFESGVFFEDGMTAPTSAVCWNAGVACSGDPEAYADCEPVDLDADGEPTTVDGASVLHPVADYVALLDALAAADPIGKDVLVSVVAGVPVGYAEGVVELLYREPDDQATADFFGIDHGCESGQGDDYQFAIPPVRLEAFAAAFADGETPNLHSVCADDYTPALQQTVDSLLVELETMCFDDCAMDIDLDIGGVQPECELVEIIPVDGGEPLQAILPECELDEVEDVMVVPAGEDTCWVARGDGAGYTETTTDDRSPSCRVTGQNLELELIRREGYTPAPGSLVEAQCQVWMIPFPSVRCP